MKLSISKKTGFKLYNNLLSQHENSEYYLVHKLDHPADVFNEAIKKVSQEFMLFKESILSHGTDLNKKIAKSLFAYVSSLSDFYQNMLLIIKLLSPTTNKINNNLEEWLKENNPEKYNDFHSAVVDSYKLIRMKAAKLEHDPSNKVGYLILSNYHKISINGFYIKKVVDGKELFLPDPEIHKEYHGGNSAFSYNYFLRYTAGFVAQCIYHLNRVLFKNIHSKSQIPPSHIIEFFESCAKISDVFLPNEYYLKNTLITNLSSIKIQFPYKFTATKHNDHIFSVDTFDTVDLQLPWSTSLFPYFQLLGYK